MEEHFWRKTWSVYKVRRPPCIAADRESGFLAVNGFFPLSGSQTTASSFNAWGKLREHAGIHRFVEIVGPWWVTRQAPMNR